MRKFLLSLCMCLFLFASLPVQAAEVEKLKGTAVVTSESLNVRSGPSKEYAALGSLKKDVSVEVIGIVEPNWYVITYGEETGYIHSDYVIFTPAEEIESTFDFGLKQYFVIALVVMILIVIGTMVYTYQSIQKKKDEEEEEIPIADHDDTNMLMGEVTYDTYRIDIDPKYFETTTILPQPESIYEEMSERKKDILGDGSGMEDSILEQTTSEADIQTLDTKLEQASAQIAALQKEVEQLKMQKPEKK